MAESDRGAQREIERERERDREKKTEKEKERLRKIEKERERERRESKDTNTKEGTSYLATSKRSEWFSWALWGLGSLRLRSCTSGLEGSGYFELAEVGLRELLWSECLRPHGHLGLRCCWDCGAFDNLRLSSPFFGCCN